MNIFKFSCCLHATPAMGLWIEIIFIVGSYVAHRFDEEVLSLGPGIFKMRLSL